MSRYFTTKDSKIDKLGKYEIPQEWWSRPYEYKFALDNLNKNDRVLDLGCGIEHPLKFYACEKVKKYVAVDSHRKILELKHDKIDFIRSDVMDFGSEEKFDKILLISTWKEFNDFKEQRAEAIVLCLAKDGKIIITDDSPFANPEEIIKIFEKFDMIPETEPNFEEPEDILTNERELKTFNITLIRKGDKVGDNNKGIQKEHGRDSKKS